MTVWETINDENRYAVAIYNYAASPGASGVPHLQLEVGELVLLERRCASWYWGRSLAKGTQGLFPRNYVEIRTCTVHRFGEEVLASASVGIAHQIALTLREWMPLWRDLYKKNDTRFKFVEVSMRALLQLRSDAWSGALPLDRLRRLAAAARATIDKGDRTLGLEVYPRENGVPLDSNQKTLYQLNLAYENNATKLDSSQENTPRSSDITTSSVRCFSLLVSVKNLVCRQPEPCELQLALYDSKGNKLTEHCTINCPKSQPQQIIFTDLNNDMRRDKIFLGCLVVRTGPLEAQNSESSRRISVFSGATAAAAAGTGGAGARRGAGAAAGDVTSYAASDLDSDTDIALPYYTCEKESMNALIKKIIQNRELKDTKHPHALWVSVKALQGDVKQIREHSPHILTVAVPVARRMGFPDVILPGDTRNDLYVTLVTGSYCRSGKTSERNIEIIARPVDYKARLIPKSVSLGAGVPLVDEYTSLVYYHEDRPKWQETFKVSLGIEEFKESILMIFARHRSSNEAKDRSEKPFAVSYLKLMQPDGTTLTDGEHNLAVYRIEYKRASTSDPEAEASAACLGVPARKEDLPKESDNKGLQRALLALQPKDQLVVHTRLTSTKLTQREEIVGILKWSTRREEGTLRDALRRLLTVPNEELVKFLQDTLDALFNILTQVEDDTDTISGYNHDSYSVLVLNCLLKVLSLVSDHKYQHFTDVLNDYIERSFCDAIAYRKLLSVLIWVIELCDTSEEHMKHLLQCMKCLPHLTHLAARSTELHAALPAMRSSDDVWQRFFSSFCCLMSVTENSALTCQGSALKFLPSAISHACRATHKTLLSRLTVAILQSLDLAVLGKQRVQCMRELCRGPLLQGQSRTILLPYVASTIADLMYNKTERLGGVSAHSRSVDKAARLLGAETVALTVTDYRYMKQMVELCVETLGEVTSLLASEPESESLRAEKVELAERTLPTLLSGAAALLLETERESDQKQIVVLRRTIAVLLDILSPLTSSEYRRVLGEKQFEMNRMCLNVSRAAIATASKPPSPPAPLQRATLSRHVKANSLIISVLQQQIPNNQTERQQLISQMASWVHVSSAVCVSWSNLMQSKRREDIGPKDDVGRIAAEAVVNLFRDREDLQAELVMEIIGPVLEMSMVKEIDTRRTVISLIYDMISTFAALPDAEAQVRQLESAMLDRVGSLVEQGRGEEKWPKMLPKHTLHSDPVIRNYQCRVIASICEATQTLLQYRDPLTGPTHRVLLTTQLIQLYKQTDRHNLYIRYVHKLCELHSEHNRWTEAALALRLHADLLSWCVPEQRREKEKLYMKVCQLLQKGQQWEMSVAVEKELQELYEREADYSSLSRLHGRLHNVYSSVSSSVAAPPAHYRVLYCGNVPQQLNSQHGFVHRGLPFEQLSQFQTRIMDEWPDATLLVTLDAPTDEIINSDTMYIRINAVEPLLSEDDELMLEQNLPGHVIDYRINNNINTFHYSRPVLMPDDSEDGTEVDEMARLWIERTELLTQDKFPNIVSCSRITSVRSHRICPLAVARDSLRKATRELRILARDCHSGNKPLTQLTMKLNGMLDAAVQGGVERLERVFLTPSYLAKHPEHDDLLQELKQLIVEQVPVLQFALSVHGALVTADLEALHMHLISCFMKMKALVIQNYPEEAAVIMSEQYQEPEPVLLRRPMADRDREKSDRNSDISTGANDGLSSVRTKFFHFNNLQFPRYSSYTSSSTGGNPNYATLHTSHHKRRGNRRTRKSDVSASYSGGSQWYTSTGNNSNHASISSTNNNNNTSVNSLNDSHQSLQQLSSPLAELTQDLVPVRPRRSEAEKRLSSARASASLGNTDSNQEDEEPPPLPMKSSRHDHNDTNNNNNGEQQQSTTNENQSSTPEPLPKRYSYDTICSPRGSFLYTSLSNRGGRNASQVSLNSINSTNSQPPQPPPKTRIRKNNQNSHN